MLRRFPVALAMLAASALQAATIIVVRHADRVASAMTADVPLSHRGLERAEALADMLKDAGIRAIYATEVKRTQQTAAPLAERLHLRMHIVPAANLRELAYILKKLPPGDVVLVVGHGNTVPAIVASLGGSTPPLGENEYDRMLILHTEAEHKTTVLTLRYGD
jgi:broad specificity phosphatase PhoE